MSVRPGTRLDGRYRLSERLAYGGMGEVWRATDEVLSREVAVKILRPELAEDEAFVRRFRAEARTTSGLPHNGIAAVYDYGETRVGSDGQSPAPMNDDEADPVAYLVMELVPGEALSSILSRDGALGSELTLDLVAQAARALHAAHQRGVIHRDIKPANLMVTPDGRVKVTDFGIARPLDHEPLTATGQVMGTAHYLAPELAKGHDASSLSDVYALGVVAYECLAGHRPFEGDNQVAVALAHLNEQPPPLSGAIAQPVRAVVGAAMEKDPQRRIPSAEAFAAALEALRYRQNGDDQTALTTGVLPGSATEAGLAAAGLISPEHRGWTPGLPTGRQGTAIGTGQAPTHVQAAVPPPGTHLLGPATGNMTGGFPQGTTGASGGTLTGGLTGPVHRGYGGAYGGSPDDPFRTPTAPGGVSITPGDRGRNRSVAGPLLALGGLAIVVVVTIIVLWLSGPLGGTSDIPGGTTPDPSPSVTASIPTASSPSTEITSATSVRSPMTSHHRPSTSTSTKVIPPVSDTATTTSPTTHSTSPTPTTTSPSSETPTPTSPTPTTTTHSVTPTISGVTTAVTAAGMGTH
jgi:hypothetical protein